MSSIVNWFQQNPIIGIIGTFIGLLLAIWSIIIGLRSRNRKLLAYYIENNNIIADYSEQFNGLTVQFNDKKIKNFSVLKITLWNEGNVTVNLSDIVKNDHLRIEGENILFSEIIRRNTTANEFSLLETIRNDKKTIEINFEYIDPGEGCVIQVFHENRSKDAISLEGKIKGIPNLLNMKDNALFSGMKSIGLIFISITASFFLPQTFLGFMSVWLGSILIILMMIIFIGLAIYLSLRSSNEYRIPKKLKT